MQLITSVRIDAASSSNRFDQSVLCVTFLRHSKLAHIYRSQMDFSGGGTRYLSSYGKSRRCRVANLGKILEAVGFS